MSSEGGGAGSAPVAAVGGAAAGDASAGKRPRSDVSVEDVVRSTAVLPALPEDGSRCIGTHHGTFHCDEALACGMLKLLPEFRDMPIVRTRDTDVLAACHIVVDVGGEYDAAKLRFDHHQRTFDAAYNDEHGIKMSSAGLVFKHFGKQIVAGAVGEELSEETAQLLVSRAYKNLIMEVDAIDNGVAMCEGKPRYSISTNLSSRVGQLNPPWNAPATPEVENELFKSAVTLALSELLQSVRATYSVWLPARHLVQAAMDDAEKVHSSGAILKLPQFCPWKSHLLSLEEERGCVGRSLYVLYQDSRGMWRVQCVPVASEGFANRKSLPAAWRGLRGDELSAVVGRPGATFVHASGFIGGHETYEGALDMAVQAAAADADGSAAKASG